MINLLRETPYVLGQNGKKPEDVLWIGNNKHYFDWAYFEKAANVEYYNLNSYKYEVPKDLVVVGKDWWLSRCWWKKTKSEGWVFNKYPNKPNVNGDFFEIFSKDGLNNSEKRGGNQ